MKQIDLKYFSEFIKRPEVRDALAKYAVGDLYLMVDRSLASGLTEFLYECGIDVLKYLDTTIPSSFFQGNQNDYIKTIHIKDNIKVIQSFAFELSALEELTYADSCKIEKIGAHAFGHTKIKSIGIPNGVKTLPVGLFMYCAELETIFLPNTITHIYNSVISGCHKLHTIYYNGCKDDWYNIEFQPNWQGTLKDKKYKIICLDGNIEMNKYID
jgi:hypothetical protein